MNCLFEKLSGQKIQCRACNHFCVISEGQRGICGIRENQKGELKLLVYNKPSAINIDPIEKKPLYHFLPGIEVYSIGTAGCNFNCAFCQNWDISQLVKSKTGIPYYKKMFPEQIVEYCLFKKIPAIAYTYNEPTVFLEYAYDIAKLAKENGLKNIFVSNGFTSTEGVEKISEVLDANNIDLKSFSNDFYQKICQSRLEPVLENIKLFYDLGVWVEATTLVIPGLNDEVDELKKIAEFLADISVDLPWHISRFYPQYQMIDKPATNPEILFQAYEIGKKAGLKYVYVGNVRDEARENTYCPICGKVAIKRMGYVVKNQLNGNKCQFCGEKIAGVFVK